MMSIACRRTAGLAACAFLFGVVSLSAQEAAQAAAPADTPPAFDPLFRVTGVKAVCQIRRPGSAVFEPAINGKAYPLGTAVRTDARGEATLLLSADDSFRLLSGSEVTVRAGDGTPANRVVHLENGKIQTDLRDGLPEHALAVESAVASCDAIAKRSDIKLSRQKATQTLEIVTGNGTLSVHGPQFGVPKLKTGCSLRIVSTEDRSETRITNLGGDYKIDLDNAVETPVSLDTSTRSAITIRRKAAPVGGKLAVSVFAAGPDGKGRETFAYVVGEPLLTGTPGGLPNVPEDRSATGTVSNAQAPAAPIAPAAATNAPKAESVF